MRIVLVVSYILNPIHKSYHRFFLLSHTTYLSPHSQSLIHQFKKSNMSLYFFNFYLTHYRAILSPPSPLLFFGIFARLNYQRRFILFCFVVDTHVPFFFALACFLRISSHVIFFIFFDCAHIHLISVTHLSPDVVSTSFVFDLMYLFPDPSETKFIMSLILLISHNLTPFLVLLCLCSVTMFLTLLLSMIIYNNLSHVSSNSFL